MEEKPVEIKQISEREIWAGESRFYLGEDDIMYVEISGNYDLKVAFELRTAFLKLLHGVEGRVNLIVDSSRGGKPSQDARKVFAEMMEDERCGKIAVVGMNPVARVIASFVLGSSKNKNTKIFKTKEEALAWVKE
jgi:hypothetical protein